MDLSNLKPAPNSVRNNIRKGRGEGSGKGGTATRGHKGAKSRSGYSRKLGFEGGQMPLHRRVPKYGFKNISRKEYKGINLSIIQKIADEKNLDTIDVDTLYKAGLAKKGSLIKILGDGEITKKLEVKAHAFSKKAQEAIESKEGNVVKL
ncbi:MAG: 50S ribosomal protein L15 [Bacteroidales bacterium]